jgi:pectinesterase
MMKKLDFVTHSRIGSSLTPPVVAVVLGAVVAPGCSADSDGMPGTGGTVASGGNLNGSGGSPATGGVLATGGVIATGGVSATGGTALTGGTSASGGTGGSATTPTGGTAGTGGSIATGGVTGTGGATTPTGGTPNTGGSASGGNGGAGGGKSTGGTASGGTASGGTAGNGGSKSTGGSAGMATGGTPSTGGTTGTCKSIAGTSTRPQLNSTEAANYTIAKYLAQAGPFSSLTTDNWDPTAGLGDASSFTPNFTVAADGSGTHTTVQAALNAATGSARRYILVKPGTYREQVTYSGSTPVTLYGASTDATKVVIIHNMSAAQGASQTFTAKSNGMQIMNLTLSNDFATPASGTNIQALALLTNGDKIVLENVRMHGFQDTVQMAAPNATTRARVYIKGGFIEGDTDYIYGSATVVLDGTTIHYLSSRKGSNAGVIFAPSTSVGNSLGFLAIRCNFTADSGAPANKNHLGRSWDASSTTPTPNGQAVVRESTIGGHINKTAPWTAAATSGRAYSATGNRFNEYCNSGPGAGP